MLSKSRMRKQIVKTKTIKGSKRIRTYQSQKEDQGFQKGQEEAIVNIRTQKMRRMIVMELFTLNTFHLRNNNFLTNLHID